MVLVILVVTGRRKRAVLPSISLMRVMGRRSCNNVRKLGKKGNGSVILTASVAVTLMTRTATRTATTVKVHDLPSGVGCLLLSRPRSSLTRSAMHNLKINTSGLCP
jgi:hypothetical protein